MQNHLYITDSSSDDASIPEERIATPDREYNYPRDHLCNSRDKIKMPSQRDNSERRHQNNAERRPQNLPPPVIHFTLICCSICLPFFFLPSIHSIYLVVTLHLHTGNVFLFYTFISLNRNR